MPYLSTFGFLIELKVSLTQSKITMSLAARSAKLYECAVSATTLI
jgi:hypothetical protein